MGLLAVTMRFAWVFSETSLWLHGEKEEVVSFKFQPSIDRHGSYYLPDFFYEGLLVGITSNNGHHLEVTSWLLVFFLPFVSLEMAEHMN